MNRFSAAVLLIVSLSKASVSAPLDDQALAAPLTFAHLQRSASTDLNPRRLLNSPKGLELAVQWIEHNANEGRQSTLAIRSVLEFLRDYPHIDLEELYQELPLLQDMHRLFKTATRPDRLVTLPSAGAKAWMFRPAILGSGLTMVDVGAGLNILGPRLMLDYPGLIRESIGVDIEEQGSREELPPNASFRLMTRPDKIPLADGVADLITATFSLHHIEVDTIDFLREIRRVLKETGRVLILDVTFSESKEINQHPQYDIPGAAKESSEIHRLFLKLNSDATRLAFLHFSDWFVHHFVNRSRAPLVPGNYHTMEVWETLFNASGFRVVEKRYLGFSRLGSRNPTSRAFFVLEPETAIQRSA